MRPILFTLPVLGQFPAYFTLLLVGFGCAWWLSVRDAHRLGMDARSVWDLNALVVFWGLVGGRLLHVIADGHFHDYVHLCTQPKLVEAIDAQVSYCTSSSQCGYDYLCDLARHVCYPPQDCLAVLKLWNGGFAYYGGFLVASVMALRFAKRRQLGMAAAADLAGYGVPLGLFFGRMGCYLNGCCFGKRCDLPWGATFLRGGPAWRSQVQAGLIAPTSNPLPVHPTQLYEALGALLLFGLCYFLFRPRKRHHGEVFAWFAGLYAVMRFMIEIWRDDERGLWLGGNLSTSQLISVPIVCAAVYFLYRSRRHAPDLL